MKNSFECVVSEYINLIDGLNVRECNNILKEASSLMCYAMLANPYISVATKEKIIRDNKYNMDFAKAEEMGLSYWTLEEFCMRFSLEGREVLASNPTFPKYCLDVLSLDPDLSVRIKVATNANTSEETLRYMLKDDCERVRYYAELRTAGIFGTKGDCYD